MRAVVRGLGEGGAQPGPHGAARHRQQVRRGVARRHPQVAVGRPQRIQALVPGVAQHRRRGVRVQHRLAAQLRQHHLPGRRPAGIRQAARQAAPQPVREGRGEAEVPRLLAADVPVQARGLLDQLEPAVPLADRLGAAQQQGAALLEREVEQGDRLGLRLRPQVDHQVAARHEVEPGERRVRQQVLHREHHRCPQVRQHPVAAVVLPGEEPGQALRGHVLGDAGGIQALPRRGHGLRLDVGGEHLQLDVLAPAVLAFAVLAFAVLAFAVLAFAVLALAISPGRGGGLPEQDDEGIDLLARAAPGDPDAQGLAGRLALQQAGDHLLRQGVIRRRVAEEAGDVDQQVLREQVQLARVAVQQGQVGGQVMARGAGGPVPAARAVRLAAARRQAHPALDAPLQRAALVGREVVPGARAQQPDDLHDLIGGLIGGLTRRCGGCLPGGRPARRRPARRRLARRRPGRRRPGRRRPGRRRPGRKRPDGRRRGRRRGSPAVAGQRAREHRNGRHLVHQPGADGAARHPVIAGLRRVLHQDQAARLLDRPQPGAPVRPGPRQHHAGGARAVRLGQRRQQAVERQPRAVRRAVARPGRREVQHPAAHGQVGAGRDDIQVLRLDRHPLRGLQDRHGGVLGQQLHQQALMAGVEVLDQDERHPSRGGESVQQPGAGLQPAGRLADRDHHEAVAPARQAARRRRARDRPAPDGVGTVAGSGRHTVRHSCVAPG